MRTRLITLLVIGLLAVTAPAALAANPPMAAFGGVLAGTQEVPAVATAGIGQTTVVISSDDTTIWYVVEYSGLSGTLAAAHIHTGAVGVNGGVILPLAAGPSPMVGTLTAADFKPSGAITTFAQAVAAIKAGNTYINLHTAANPGGEIRGQVTSKGNAYFASFSGAQEIPAVAAAGTGNGWVVVSTDGATLTYYVEYGGLSGPAAAAHIHLGAAGLNGGVLLPLAVGASPFTGTLSAADIKPTGGVTDLAGAITAIAAGGTYINIHTAAHPGGELRGQLAVTVVPAATAAPTANPTLPPTSTAPLATGSADPMPAWLFLLTIAASASMLISSRRRDEARRRQPGNRPSGS